MKNKINKREVKLWDKYILNISTRDGDENLRSHAIEGYKEGTVEREMPEVVNKNKNFDVLNIFEGLHLFLPKKVKKKKNYFKK